MKLITALTVLMIAGSPLILRAQPAMPITAPPLHISDAAKIGSSLSRNLHRTADETQDAQAARTKTSVPDGIAINLAAINDWSTQQPFLDVMKTARPWIGHLPGRWGGVEYETLLADGLLDQDGWPLRKPDNVTSIATMILTDLPAAAVSLKGRYVLKYTGSGIVEVAGRAQNKRYGENSVSFDFTPGPGPVDVRIQRSDPADPIRAITVVREDRIAAFDAGEIFNPDWLSLLNGFGALRFMDWMNTNNATLTDWSNRPRLNDFTYAQKGVPVEIITTLANTLGADPWVNLPHLANDAYMRGFAEALRDGLDPERKAIVEFSNEVWNWQFTQTAWAAEQAEARWNAKDTGLQFYALRASQMAQIFADVIPQDRLITVLSSQTGWLGLEDSVLNAPLWQQEGQPAPHTLFDAYAVTGYFGGIIGSQDRAPMVRGWLSDSLKNAQDMADAKGLIGSDRDAFIAAHRFDHATDLAAQELRDGAISGDGTDSLDDLLDRTLPWHRDVAARYDLQLVMYEGGTHVLGLGELADDAPLTEFFIHLNYTPEMGALYRALIAGWDGLGGKLFNAYNDVYAPTKWGSWGARRYLSDDSPRWQALEAAK